MKIYSGDICDAEEEHVAHGCNAQGKMNSGVAKAIRERFPGVFDQYISHLRSAETFGIEVLGTDCTHYDLETGKTIHNLITQKLYGSDGKKYARYKYLVGALSTMLDHDPSIREVAIPRIGCGLGGLDWEVVRELLLELEEDYDVQFIVYDHQG